MLYAGMEIGSFDDIIDGGLEEGNIFWILNPAKYLPIGFNAIMKVMELNLSGYRR